MLPWGSFCSVAAGARLAHLPVNELSGQNAPCQASLCYSFMSDALISLMRGRKDTIANALGNLSSWRCLQWETSPVLSLA